MGPRPAHGRSLAAPAPTTLLDGGEMKVTFEPGSNSNSSETFTGTVTELTVERPAAGLRTRPVRGRSGHAGRGPNSTVPLVGGPLRQRPPAPAAGGSRAAPARRRARRRARARPPGRTPSPTATARLSSTTGDGASCGERVVERGDPLPVGLLGACARARGRRRSRPAARTGRARRRAPRRARARPGRGGSAAGPSARGPGRAAGPARRAGPIARARAATPGSPSARPGRAPPARAGASSARMRPSRSASSHSAGRIQSSPAVAA